MNKLLFFLTFLTLTSCQDSHSDPLIKALLNEKWDIAETKCLENDSLFKHPHTIGILGHVYIMQNKPNESYLLLKALEIDSIKIAWMNWTEDLVLNHPKSAIAHYLRGDALMRNSNQVKALGHFNKAIKLAPDFPLAYNARGTIYSLAGEIDKAYNDLNKACKLTSNNAVLLTNRTTALYNSEFHNNVYEGYSKALKSYPNYALALNGKASVIYLNNPQNLTEVEKRDSTNYYLNLAKYYLNHPVFSNNSRIVLVDSEKKIYLDQTTPYFRVSDFLNWDLMVQLARNEGDLLNYLFEGVISTELSIEFINHLNTFLNQPNLFKAYSADKSNQVQFKHIIHTTNEQYFASLKSNEVPDIRTLNRLVFEAFYNGLITFHLNRNVGTTIAKEVYKNVSADVITTADYILNDLNVEVGYDFSERKPIGEVRYNFKSILKDVVDIGLANRNTQNQLNNLNDFGNEGIMFVQRNYPQAVHKAYNQGKLSFIETRPQSNFNSDQGGLKFDGEKLLERPSPLTCLNSLAYETK